MAETRKYWIRIDGRPVEVTRKVYADYYHMRRRERYLEERDLDHGKTLYSQLDDGYMTGEDMLPDRGAVPVEEVVEALLMTEKLTTAKQGASGSVRPESSGKRQNKASAVSRRPRRGQ